MNQQKTTPAVGMPAYVISGFSSIAPRLVSVERITPKGQVVIGKQRFAHKYGDVWECVNDGPSSVYRDRLNFDVKGVEAAKSLKENQRLVNSLFLEMRSYLETSNLRANSCWDRESYEVKEKGLLDIMANLRSAISALPTNTQEG